MWEHISPILLLKMKVSGKFVTVSRRDLRYPVLTDYLPFFQISLANTGARLLKLLFYPPKCLEGFVTTGKKWWFCSKICLEVKPLPSWWRGDRCPAVQKDNSPWPKRSKHAPITNFCARAHTEVKTCETLFLAVLILTFPNDCLLSLFTSISATPSLLISSSCCIYNCSLFLFPLHRCVLLRTWKGVLPHVSWLKMNAEYNSVPSPFFFSFFYYNTSMHVCCYDGGEISRSRQQRRCIFPRGLSDCVLVPLQRPVQWTMVAVIAHVMIQWQESAAAVLLASLCSRTARPAKVKHRHSNCSCHHINPPPVVLPGTLELLPPPGAHGNYCQAIYTIRTLPVRTISYLRVGFFCCAF